MQPASCAFACNCAAPRLATAQHRPWPPHARDFVRRRRQLRTQPTFIIDCHPDPACTTAYLRTPASCFSIWLSQRARTTCKGMHAMERRSMPVRGCASSCSDREAITSRSMISQRPAGLDTGEEPASAGCNMLHMCSSIDPIALPFSPINADRRDEKLSDDHKRCSS